MVEKEIKQGENKSEQTPKEAAAIEHTEGGCEVVDTIEGDLLVVDTQGYITPIGPHSGS